MNPGGLTPELGFLLFHRALLGPHVKIIELMGKLIHSSQILGCGSYFTVDGHIRCGTSEFFCGNLIIQFFFLAVIVCCFFLFL
jgi:hypothetical protein